MHVEHSESIWEQLSPILDQAMGRLGAADRNVLVLRYFENKTAKDVGTALGINEAAAQKRLVRAVEKLRSFCTKKGVALSAVALTTVLSANAVQAAPAGVATATAAALKGGAISASTGALTSATLKFIAWTKFKIAGLAGLGFATLVVGTAFFFSTGHWSEPTYQNQRVGVWLEQLDNHDQTFSSVMHWIPWQAELRQTPKQVEAAQAIRAMGTNLVPYLIAVLKKDEVSRFERLMGQSPGQLLDRHRQAALALDALGPECKPWLPELSRILHDARCPKEAAIALAAIGPEGWEVLTRDLAETNEVVTCSAWALGSHHAVLPGTVPALLAACARNKPLSVDILALWAVEEIKPDQEQLVPLLLEGLKSDRQDLKWGSAVVLGRMGRRAISAVPALTELLGDRNPLVRHDAAQALEQIDPPTAARAGVTGALVTEHVPKTMIF